MRHRSELSGLVAILASTMIATSAHAALAISNGATKNVTCAAGVCAATAKNAVLNAGDLATMLASSDVAVESTSKARDIELKVSLSFASGNRLTLDAYRSITVSKPLTVAGSGGLTLTTNDGGTSGEFSIVAPGRVDFWDLSSSLVIDGVSYALVNNIATLASGIAANPSGHYALASSYDASVDGTYTTSPIATFFSGTFDGLGQTISNLVMNNPKSGGDDVFGFFRATSSAARLAHIRLSGVNLTSNGHKKGFITSAGALAGTNLGVIFESSAIGSMTTRNSATEMGGLVGGNGGTIANSFASMEVSGPDFTQAVFGGLVALNQGEVASSYATGNVAGGSAVGGLVGLNIGGRVDTSFANGEVSGTSGIFGGLIGENYGYDGLGIGMVTNSYATGSVMGGDFVRAAGGLVGQNDPQGNIATSYSAGTVVGGVTVGGLVGTDYSTALIGQSDWDLDGSGISDPGRGAGNVYNDPGITGLSDAQLKSGLPVGFDPSIWAENPSINGGLPYLIANPPP